MSKGPEYFREKTINVAKQDLMMKRMFPQFQLLDHHGEKYWIGRLDSSLYPEISYLVKIVYDPIYPKVFILEPTLLSKCPHIYSDDSLCLFYPKDQSFNCEKYITQTIVPWTCEWIYFYEKWFVEGVWWGEEAPHETDSRRGLKISNRYLK